jgi:hypothetical protein
MADSNPDFLVVPIAFVVGEKDLFFTDRDKHLNVNAGGNIADIVVADPVLDSVCPHCFGVVSHALVVAQKGAQNVGGIFYVVDGVFLF